jgi:hypothetical protein
MARWVSGGSIAMTPGAPEFDSGWVGAGPHDDLDRKLRDEDDEWDRTQPRVETVLGPVAPGALGPVLAGEPIVALAGLPTANDDALDGRHALLAELEDAYASGARTVVSVPSLAVASAVDLVGWLASRSQTHLVRLASPGELDDAAEHLPSGIAGVSASALVPKDVSLAFDFAARWRCPVRVEQAGNPQRAVGIVRQATSAGVPAARCSVSVGDSTDAGALAAVAECGASVVLAATEWSDATALAELVASLVAGGHAERILVSSGFRHPDELVARGGTRGLGWLMERLPLVLMDAGLAAVDVRRILVDNPARWLTIEPGGE